MSLEHKLNSLRVGKSLPTKLNGSITKTQTGFIYYSPRVGQLTGLNLEQAISFYSEPEASERKWIGDEEWERLAESVKSSDVESPEQLDLGVDEPEPEEPQQGSLFQEPPKTTKKRKPK